MIWVDYQSLIMREPASNQHGSVKRFTYNGPNSKTNPKDNSVALDDWFSGLPTKAKSEQSLLNKESELDDVWSIRKNVSATLSQPTDPAITQTHPSNTGHYSRHGQYNKASKLGPDSPAPGSTDGAALGGSGGYSYGQSRSSYSYGAGGSPGLSSGSRFTSGPNATQGQSKGFGMGPPLLGRSRSPTRSISGRSQVSQHSRGKASDTWSSF